MGKIACFKQTIRHFSPSINIWTDKHIVAHVRRKRMVEIKYFHQYKISR